MLLFLSILFVMLKVNSDKKSSGSSVSSRSSSSSGDRRDGFGRFGHSVGLRMTFRDWLWFMYLTEPRRYSYDPVPVQVTSPQEVESAGAPDGGGSPNSVTAAREVASPIELGFFEAIFSFVFGDGSPNANFARSETNRVGKVIRSCGGAVVKEQLLPFVDSELLKEETERDQSEERFVLPLLEYFNVRNLISSHF